MKIKKNALNKALGITMAGCTLLSTVAPAFATDIDVAGGAADVPMVVTAEAARFSVNIPTVLPINVNADGVVTVADDVYIVNNSHGSVVVDDMSLTGTNGWDVVDYETDMATQKVSDTKIAVDINGNLSIDNGLDFDASTFDAMAGDIGEEDLNRVAIVYDAKLPAQAVALDDVSVMDLTVVVGWNYAE